MNTKNSPFLKEPEVRDPVLDQIELGLIGEKRLTPVLSKPIFKEPETVGFPLKEGEAEQIIFRFCAKQANFL